MHYSYLNAAYNMDVIKDWQKGGCIDSIKRSLGYRFVLLDLTVSCTVKKGAAWQLTMRLENKGYASPFNPRSVFIILRNQLSHEDYTIPCHADIRSWFTGEVSFT